MKGNIVAVTEKAVVEEKRRKGRLQKKGERTCCWRREEREREYCKRKVKKKAVGEGKLMKGKGKIVEER